MGNFQLSPSYASDPNPSMIRPWPCPHVDPFLDPISYRHAISVIISVNPSYSCHGFAQFDIRAHLANRKALEPPTRTRDSQSGRADHPPHSSNRNQAKSRRTACEHVDLGDSKITQSSVLRKAIRYTLAAFSVLARLLASIWRHFSMPSCHRVPLYPSHHADEESRNFITVGGCFCSSETPRFEVVGAAPELMMAWHLGGEAFVLSRIRRANRRH